MSTPMERSYLVQRLKKPRNFERLGIKDNPFAFGGGLKNGGLSDEAMGLLRGIFAFDYMGSAEFEFGAVPKALNEIANNADEYASFELEIPLANIAPNWQDEDKTPPPGFATIYGLCREARVAEVLDRIEEMASRSYDTDMKESTHLAASLRPFGKWDTDICGWLELDNAFAFFTDKTMFEETARLFGIEVGDERIKA